jgi:hypothetical protein
MTVGADGYAIPGECFLLVDPQINVGIVKIIRGDNDRMPLAAIPRSLTSNSRRICLPYFAQLGNSPASPSRGSSIRQ